MSEPLVGENGGLRSDVDVSMYLSSLNGIDTALLYYDAFRRQGTRVHLCVPERIMDDVRASGDHETSIVVIPKPTTALGRTERAHRLFIDFASSLVSGDNPDNALLWAPSARWKAQTVRFLRALPGKPGGARVNRIGRRIFGRHTPCVFPSRHVLAISFAERPLLLCRPDLIVDTVVDSWDHPVRRTAGYSTRVAVGWNQDLASDWQRYQGAAATIAGPSVRLAYATKRGSGPTTRQRRALYAVASTPGFSDWFRDESLVIEALCEAAKDAGWTLVIKPRPDSAPGSLDVFAEGRPHVRIGGYHTSYGPLDYRLDGAYNERRLAELSAAAVVISAVTTFSLDTAAAGVPLLQLDVGRLRGIPNLSAAARNYHLRTHLYRATQASLMRPITLHELKGSVSGFLRGGDLSRAAAASAELRRWLLGDGTTVDEVTESLLLAR